MGIFQWKIKISTILNHFNTVYAYIIILFIIFLKSNIHGPWDEAVIKND